MKGNLKKYIKEISEIYTNIKSVTASIMAAVIGIAFTVIISLVAILFSAINIGGGFYITRRMLDMFKKM